MRRKSIANQATIASNIAHRGAEVATHFTQSPLQSLTRT